MGRATRCPVSHVWIILPTRRESPLDELKLDLKHLLIQCLMLEEVQPSDIGDDMHLFGDDGLGLDSVDALELVLEIERRYGVTIEDNEESRSVLQSIDTLARHVQRHRIPA